MKSCLLILFGVLRLSAVSHADDGLSPDLAGYTKAVQPLLHQYCFECHDERKAKGKIRLDTIDPDLPNGEHTGVWEDVLEQLKTGEMPPEDEKQPTLAEREIIIHWLDGEFKKTRLLGRPNRKGPVRRLTRYELEYTLEDIFDVSVDGAIEALPKESASPETGLKNSSRLLMVGGPFMDSYMGAIFSTIDQIRDFVKLEPISVELDFAGVDLKGPLVESEKKEEPVEAPPKKAQKKKSKKKPGRSPFRGVEKEAGGLTIAPKGFITLSIPRVPKHVYDISFSARADGPSGRVQASVGFQYSAIDTREFVSKLGVEPIEASEKTRRYSYSEAAEKLPDEILHSLDRIYFVRLTNLSPHPVFVESFGFEGDSNAEIKARLLDRPASKQDGSGIGRDVISSFLSKAFRRTPSETEVLKYDGIYQAFLKDQSSFDALLSTYEEILCSPKFFYLGLPAEVDAEQNHQFKLAERLSYFLWCTKPDQALLDDAATGVLTEPAVLASHVRRMLKDERSRRLVENFTEQWLHTSTLFNVAVDPTYYRGFKDTMKELMWRETVESINDVFRHGAPALDLLKADHVFVNDVLARHYKIKGVSGAEFRKVKVGEKDHRGGLLSQGTFLVGNSDGIDSHAILRGVWLTGVVLNNPPPDPPKNVPPFDESIPGFEKMTLNQKMFHHRNHQACASCHNKIDPWGIPFENYDASGAYRDKVLSITKADNKKRGKKANLVRNYIEIERKATLPSQDEVDGMEELKDYIVKNKHQDFAEGLTEKLLSYALYRDVDLYDAELVERLRAAFMANEYSVPSLIEDIVLSDEFQMRSK